MTKKIEKRDIATFAVFAAFFALLCFQLSNVFMYADDYGYAALGVVDGFEATGTDFTISELIEFLRLHYLTWGGRVLWFFIEILLLKCGLAPTRLVEAVALTLLFYLIYRVVGKKGPIAASLVCLCYGLFGIKLISDAFFWFSASYFYVVPLPFALFAVWVCARVYKKQHVPKWQRAFAFFAAAPGAWSQEHVAAAFLVTLGLLFVFCVFEDKKLSKDSLYVLSVCALAAVFAAALVLAKGNSARNTALQVYYPSGLFNRLLFGFNNLSSTLFSRWNALLLLALFLFGLLCSLTNKKINRALRVVSLLFILVGTGVLLLGFDGNNMLITEMKTVKYLACWLALSASAAWLVALLIKNKRLDLLAVLGGSGTALAMCVFTAVVEERTLAPFSLLLLAPLAYGYAELTDNAAKKKLAEALALAVFAVVFAVNVGTITAGYMKNAPVNIQNDKLLRQASERISGGEDVNTVTVYMLPDSRSTSMQPYFDSQGYLYDFIAMYYELPSTTAICYLPHQEG